MESRSTRGAGALLERLVGAAAASGDATALLHERVVLHRIDGTSLAGRVEVVDAVANRGSDARLRVLALEGETVRVALEVPGLEGYFVLELTGLVEAGVLVEIRMA